MLERSTNVLEDIAMPSAIGRETSYDTFVQRLTAFVTRFKIHTRNYPSMIGELLEVETDKQVAMVSVPRTEHRIKFRYDKRIEPDLLANRSKLIEIKGKIGMDKLDNPVLARSVKQVNSVDTSDIDISEVLPDSLQLTHQNPLMVNVDLDETQRFYSAELESLNLFACGLSREHLKDRLRENLEICWDEFVTEDSSDLSQDALDLRERLLDSFREVKQ